MIGKKILHYHILKKLGEGGMGVVYLAEDTKLERKVAIKFLPGHISKNSDERRRLEIEAKAAAALNHPNISTIYAIEEVDEEVFIVMEYIDGIELKNKIDSGQLMLKDVLKTSMEIAEGLQAAHEKGVIHRDIKSSNIMLTTKAKVKIMDFGLAKVGQGIQLTKENSTLGTAPYMSPEQIRGNDVDQKSDVWSFGVIMYEMLTGQLPFQGDYEQAVTYSIVNENPKPISVYRSGVPHELEKIVNKCLEKNPENRYQNAEDILINLRLIEHGIGTEQLRNQKQRSQKSSPKKSHKLFITIVAILVVLLLISSYFLFRGEDESGEKISIAVVDVVNETNEKELNSLSGLIITALEQSRRLSVVTRSRMFDILKQLGYTDVNYINEKMGMEICKQANIEALAVTSIRRLGNRYAIDLKVLNPFKNEHLVTAKEEDDGEENIFAMIDRLAETTRKGLKEKSEELQAAKQKIANVTTTNLEAYEHYFKGDELISKLKFNQAIEEFKEAISLDSTFALAYYRLGYAYDWYATNKERVRETLEKAMTMVDRIPEKERYLLRAQKAHLEGGYQASIAVLEEGVKKYPNDKEIIYNFGDFLYHEGRYDESITYLKKVLAMDPGHERALGHIIYTCRALKLYDKAIDYGKQYVKQSNSVEAFADLGISYWDAGDFISARKIYQQGIQIYPENALLLGRIGEMYTFQGEYNKAETYFKTLITEEKSNAIRISGYKGLAKLYPYLGKYKLAMKMYDSILELYRQDKNMHMLAEWGIFKAFLMLRGGEKEEYVMKEAEQTLNFTNPGCLPYNIHLARIYTDFNDFEKANVLNNQYVDEHHRPVIMARHFMNGGEWEKAVAVYNSLQHFIDFPELRYQLAQCYFELGQWQKAFEELNVARNLFFGIWHGIIFPKSFYLAGKIYEQKGDINLAIENYNKFLELWKNADNDMPELIDAKKRIEKLKKTGIKMRIHN